MDQEIKKIKRTIGNIPLHHPHLVQNLHHIKKQKIAKKNTPDKIQRVHIKQNTPKIITLVSSNVKMAINSVEIMTTNKNSKRMNLRIQENFTITTVQKIVLRKMQEKKKKVRK